MNVVLIFTIWAFLSILLPTTILADFPTKFIWTDLFFFLIFILGLRFKFLTGFILSFVFGYIADTISYVPYGTMMIAYVSTFLVLRMLRLNIYMESKGSIIFWIFFFSLFCHLIQNAVLYVKLGVLPERNLLISHLLLQSAWDTFLGFLIIPILDKALSTDWSLVFRKKGLKDK